MELLVVWPRVLGLFDDRVPDAFGDGVCASNPGCELPQNARPRTPPMRYPSSPGRRRSRSWPGGHLREGACGGSSCAFDPAREGGEPWLRNDVDSRGAAKPAGFYGSDYQ